MLGLGWLGFTQPWLLAALLGLPALWWLLRIIPPAPQRIRFPAIRFLFGLEPEEQTSARTPLWLLILRLALAALLILALAGPVLNPEPELDGDGPLVLVVDDGWAAAADWDERVAMLTRFTERAQRDHREVVLVRTAPEPGTVAVERMSAADARGIVASLVPKPWPVDRAAALAALEAEDLTSAQVVWLSDGLAVSEDDRRQAGALADALQGLGELLVYADPAPERSPLLRPPELGGEGLEIALERADGPAATVGVRAVGPNGETLARREFAFAAGDRVSRAAIDLPTDVLNRIARVELDPPIGIAGVVLLDERWRRRVVGMIGPSAAQEPQPLLAELYYVERALSPYAELRRGGIAALLEQRLSAIVLPDSAVVSPENRAELAAWVEAGGVLIRFAGTRLASNQMPGDDLIPVELRRGDRNLDGALTWAEPLPLASFDEDGPLHDLGLAEGDVVVRRQVLAQPGPELARRSWARLADGTPLVTGARRGEGWLVLIHTTANTAWSSLPLSGVFVDMLRRIVGLGAGAGGAVQGPLAPLKILDADGRLVEPPPAVEPLDAAAFADARASARHPPGLYGPVGAAEEVAGDALNLASAVPALHPLDTIEFDVEARPFAVGSEVDLMPWILLAALLLALADTLIGLWMRGLLPRVGRLGGATAGLALLLAGGGDARAQVDESIVAATSETRLAYVATGLPTVDEVSRAGLEGLSLVLNRRTAVEAGDPRAVDVRTDDLALFPLLYWPVPPDHPDLSPDARQRVANYLRNGGMILFDTGDAGNLIPGQGAPGPGELRLRELLDGVSLPPLEPVPEDHTLTRSFYLLQEFPGRWTGSEVWVDRVEPEVNDGVSSIVIGSHDWAAAWATDDYGMATFPVMPGGERQREMARRFGINLVMYALTGNYKTDQVHIPALLERLGQ